MILDLTSSLSAKQTIASLLGINSKTTQQQLDIIGREFNASDVFSDYITHSIDRKYRESLIKFFHVTTVYEDDLQSFIELGLITLKESLIKTKLGEFLTESDIQFDIDNEKVMVAGKVFELSNKKWSRIYERIYGINSNINGFSLFNPVDFNYSMIIKAPEFLNSLDIVLQDEGLNMKLESKWEENSHPFIIEANIPIEKVDLFSNQDDSTLQSFIEFASNSARSTTQSTIYDSNIIYLKKNINISPLEIVSYEKIDYTMNLDL